MAMIGENQVRNFFVVDSSTNTTISDIRNGVKLNAAIVQSDGTAAADNEEFMLALQNNRAEMTISDKVDPTRVSYAHSVPFAPRVGTSYLISDIVAEANKLYQVRLVISGYGSLSVENEYIKEAFYKSKTGDDAEDIIDGLVKSLARNLSRDQPSSGGRFTYPAKSGDIVLPDNYYFEFDKTSDDGTAEVSTITVTAVPTADGVVKVTLNGVEVSIPVTASGATVTSTANKIATKINALNDYTATNTAGVVTVTATNLRDEDDIVFSVNGTAGIAATTATTTDGADGTDFALKISEKSDYLSRYYVTGKKDRLTLDYKVVAAFPTDATVVVTKGSTGSGTGYQVRNMEYYFLGNRADTFRGAGYPHNFEQNYDSNLEGEYHLIEIGYFDEGRNDPMKSKKQLTIACPTKAVANKLIAQINTALNTVGKSIATV